MTRKLKRVSCPEFEWISGVCAGIAYCLGAPTWIIRLLWVVITLWGIPHASAFVAIYIILSIFMPAWDKVPKDYRKICE
ncbi:PspC domain-containing protein [Candidatus Falkowbacteria bacterium]|nr:PspC domain-containing protein [Candidatus Falkowbacteria bacterium]